jgi:hypothetical protein
VFSTQISSPLTLRACHTLTGKHLRHARDHFALLLNGLDGIHPRRVSYDTRVRNTPMETSRSAGVNAFQETIERLRSLQIKDIDDELTLDAITPYPQTLKSSIGREVSSLPRGCKLVPNSNCTRRHLAVVWLFACHTSLDNGV